MGRYFFTEASITDFTCEDFTDITCEELWHTYEMVGDKKCLFFSKLSTDHEIDTNNIIQVRKLKKTN